MTVVLKVKLVKNLVGTHHWGPLIRLHSPLPPIITWVEQEELGEEEERQVMSSDPPITSCHLLTRHHRCPRPQVMSVCF